VKVLVTGGVRCGKSTHAEALVADLAGGGPVLYIAPGPVPDPLVDEDWAARVAAHRARRPGSWTSVETAQVEAALGAAEEPVLVDCLGTWLTRVVDDHDAWDAPADHVRALVDDRLAAVAAAVRACPHDVVLVSNEVGWGVVPVHRSGRLFRDLLGTVNQRVAEACNEVHLVVAGRVLRL
jgi:adenosylcobinamide kinase/adenosylcobinamide-phosphate guanylyltransferase